MGHQACWNTTPSPEKKKQNKLFEWWAPSNRSNCIRKSGIDSGSLKQWINKRRLGRYEREKEKCCRLPVILTVTTGRRKMSKFCSSSQAAQKKKKIIWDFENLPVLNSGTKVGTPTSPSHPPLPKLWDFEILPVLDSRTKVGNTNLPLLSPPLENFGLLRFYQF